MPALTYNRKTIRFHGREDKGRTRPRVRKILCHAERHGAASASRRFDEPYQTVRTWCDRADIPIQGIENMEPAARDEYLSAAPAS